MYFQTNDNPYGRSLSSRRNTYVYSIKSGNVKDYITDLPDINKGSLLNNYVVMSK